MAAVSSPVPASSRRFLAVVTGNPNCGKTTVFNALTGLRAKVGNYAGVTVERKEGRVLGLPPEAEITLLDLPGSYSLSPQSLDEQIARDVLLQRLTDVPPPDLVVIVMDASNIERNLYYATQVLELGYPTVVALNMMDVAESNGQILDVTQLAARLGVPVVPTVANTRQGLPALRGHLLAAWRDPRAVEARRFVTYPDSFSQEAKRLAADLRSAVPPSSQPEAESVLILSDARNLSSHAARYGAWLEPHVVGARQRLKSAGLDWSTLPIEARYNSVGEIRSSVMIESRPPEETFSDRLDRIVTHKIWGTLIFFALMGLMFQSIFSFAKLPMNALEQGVQWVGNGTAQLLPPGDLRSLLADGVVAGVGAVVVFLPQICLLFLFIGLLEDSGYMARAAFLMDRLMSKVGLHGKSFIPMLSSFACAIPGILSTRTIGSQRDRLVTILIAPLMSCSARLPVYTVLIGACIPNRKVLGLFRLPGITLLAMYLLGITAALTMAWILKRTLLRGETPLLIMELPPYKRPSLRTLGRHVWDRAGLFLRNAGTIILGINILLWFLATYPHSAELSARFDQERMAAVRAALPDVRTDQQTQAVIHRLRHPAPEATKTNSDSPRLEPETLLARKLAQLDAEEAGAAVRQSFAGRLGRLIEPILSPLGFDWKIGIGIVASFAAREVFVSTMAVVYNLGREGEPTGTLEQTLREQRREDGSLVYTTRTGLTLMVFYVLALQCASTVSVVHRETGGWKWPLFQWTYMASLAWVAALLTRVVGKLAGLE